MSVYEEIVSMVETNFYNEKYDFIMWGSHDETMGLKEAIGNLLMTHTQVAQYAVHAVDAFDSPGYGTGIVYAAWVERDGSLHTIDYQWEAM